MAEPAYPLHISRALLAAEERCTGSDSVGCHDAALKVADALVYYLGAVAVAQYSQATYAGEIEADPTLNRSLRSLKRLLPGQWLLWTARGLEAVHGGVVEGLAGWYSAEQGGEVASAYTALREVMVRHLAYTGEYGSRETASPRVLLELVDQYRIRRSRMDVGSLPEGIDGRVAEALLPGLRALLGSAGFLARYELYSPTRRQLLKGPEAAAPLPPLMAPADVIATIFLYPPVDDPERLSERVPLFPLDPLLVYVECPHCGRHRVAALQGMEGVNPVYLGLDPDCGHTI